MKINIKDISVAFLSCFSLLINVYLVTPFVTYIIYNRLKCVVYIVPLSLSILAFNIVPTYEYDLYRIYEALSQYKINGEFNYARDGLLISLFYLFDTLSINQSLLPALSCFFIYFSKIFFAKNFFERYLLLNRNLWIVFVLISIFSVPLLQFSGIRFSTALAFLTLGLYSFSANNRLLGILFYALAVFSHASAILFILVYVVNILVKIDYYKYRMLFIFMAIIMSFDMQLIINAMVYISGYVNDFFGWSFFSVDTYVDGAWGVERAISLNKTGQLVLTFTKTALCTILIVNVFFFCSKEFSALLVSLTAITICLYDFGTLFDRFGQFCILVLIANMIHFYTYNCRSKLHILNSFSVLFVFILFRALEFKDAFNILSVSNSDIYNLSLFHLLVELLD
ncbi:EpsG family protein [Aeromonas dhakensis]|uniref:EpsG family protein n=1 Tax=Aeromonas dhakensis TaxID=196024 RepID=UPI002B470A25|nr:EpsG family protein [Aeromonas dhakensis]